MNVNISVTANQTRFNCDNDELFNVATNETIVSSSHSDSVMHVNKVFSLCDHLCDGISMIWRMWKVNKNKMQIYIVYSIYTNDKW